MSQEFDPQVMNALRRIIDQVVAPDLALPEHPRDGDCLDWAPRITTHLKSAGIAAATVTVIGWTNRATKVLVFVHLATHIDGGVMVDGTARQFSPAFPPLLVTTLSNYCAKLAELTGVAEVSVELDPTDLS